MNLYHKGDDENNIYQKFNQEPYAPGFGPLSLEYKAQQNGEASRATHLKEARVPIEQHDYYVALIVDPYTGKVSKRSSPALRQYRDDILREAVPKLEGYVQAFSSGAFDAGDVFRTECVVSTSTHEKVRQIKNQHQRPKKRRKGGDVSNASDSASIPDDESTSEKSGYVTFRADATDEWRKWFFNAFRAVQQVSCRIIAKEWIKTIHPKKQSTHPYNGKDPKTGERGDPSTTKPPYWPDDVIHKEPDHINKEARTKLLVHLLMNTPHKEMSISGDSNSDKEITAMVLKESLGQKKHESQHNDLKRKFSIVEDIIEVRTTLEQFKDGGLPPDTLVTARDFSDVSRCSKPDGDSDEMDEVLDTPCRDEIGEDESDVLSNALHDDSGVSNKNTTPVSQQEQIIDKERRAWKSQKGSRRMEGPHPANISASSRTPFPHLPPNPHHDLGFRPPLIMPEWDTFGRDPSTIAKQEHVRHSSVHDQSPHEVYGSMNWGTVHPGMEMASQFNNHCMITPTHMVNGPPQNAYLSGCFSGSQQQHFGGIPQSQFDRPTEYRNELHDSRSDQARIQVYDTFVAQHPPNHVYYSM